jgi:hypothetical protein
MGRGFVLLSGLLLLLAHPATSRAAEAEPAAPNIPARFNFEAFHLITERNIFNPHRSSRGDSNPSPPKESERRVRTQSFSLLGTMSYEKGRFAFFDGSNSDYRRVLRASDSIGGFKIAEVAPSCVRLENTNGQSIELCVGMQMAKREEEDWRVRESNGSSTATAETNSTAGSAETDDVVKRLLQRREQEGGLPPTASTPPSPPPATDAPPAAASSNETDEVVKRLLQKREQELNK